VIPTPILLDSSVQLLMLGTVAMEGFKMINANIKPCLYYILTSMGGLKKAWGLTKLNIVIQVNPN
jgi:hypothetical protein